MKKLLIVMFLAIIIFVGCDSAENDSNASDNVEEFLVEETREFDIEEGEHGYLAVRYLEHMQEILPYRLGVTERELETAEWIVDILLGKGFDEDQIEMQTFRYDTETTAFAYVPWWIERRIEQGYYDGHEWINYSQNIILAIPGSSEKTIVIGAHYDSVGYPGISDNASGVALLLENAYRMRDQDHYHTLQYVFFGAHEIGMIGTFYFVDGLTDVEVDNLIFMINADVILDGPNLTYALGYFEDVTRRQLESVIVYGRTTMPPEVSQNELTMQIENIADELNAAYDTGLIINPSALFATSDHIAFLEFGIPIMYLHGTNPVEYPELFYGDVLHTPDDDLDFIMENFPGRIEQAYDSFGRLLERILMTEF